MKRAFAFLALGCCIVTLTSAQVLDQESPYGCSGGSTATFNMFATSLTWQQDVTVGISGQLVQIDVYVSVEGSCFFFLNAGPPWQTDTNDFEMTFTSDGTGWNTIDVSSAGLNFSVNDHFVIGFQGTSDGLQCGGSYKPPGGCYLRGAPWLNGAHHTPGDDWDIGFRSYVGSSVTPTPSVIPTETPTFVPTGTPTVVITMNTPVPVPAENTAGRGLLIGIISILLGVGIIRKG